MFETGQKYSVCDIPEKVLLLKTEAPTIGHILFIIVLLPCPPPLPVWNINDSAALGK
jgi:hypothetical protein